MAGVLKERERATRRLDSDAVHDLRVALRRSRTIADGLSTMDPDPVYSGIKKVSRKLFRSMGKLRDVQVMQEWSQKLAPEDDAVKPAVREALAKTEEEARAAAESALAEFDARQWRRRCRMATGRAKRIPVAGPALMHLAVQRWSDAYEMHRRALHSRSRVGWHRLRIAVKKFRYTIENFAPREAAAWGEDLKKLQDLLGEVHDLDILRTELRKLGPAFDATEREKWGAWIEAERAPRLREYRANTTGKNSLWRSWRAGLPQGQKLETAAMTSLATWGAFLDPDTEHARRVTGLTVELFDAFQAAGLHGTFRDERARRILYAAALLHDVGRWERENGHHKASFKLISERRPPAGWTEEDMLWTALVARYHRGAEPQADQEGLSSLSPSEQEAVTWLAATLRVADALDAEHNGRVLHARVSSTRTTLLITAEGYIHDVESAALLGRKKHLLESLCGRPVIVAPAEAPAVAPLRARTMAATA